MSIRKVFVTDAQQRNSLAIVRSLGKHGISVDAGEDTRFATAFFSKYCSRYIVYPNAEKYQDKFVGFLIDYLKNNQYDVFFPVTNATVIPTVKHLNKIAKYVKVPIASEKIMMKALDKSQTIQIAKKCDVPIPETFSPKSISEIDSVIEQLTFPIVVKPRIGYGARGVSLCNNKDEVFDAYERNLSLFGSSLIQEYIPAGGDELGVYSLFNYDAEPRAVTVHRRIRSYPHSGGPSTMRETVLNPDLIDKSFKLLSELEWFGVSMVEYRVDPRDNIPKLMEINPRWWGSLPLSIYAGVDFPYLLYKLIIDGEIEKDLNYKIGVKCRWMLPGDILHLITAPGVIKNFKEFIKFKQKDMAYDILSSEDSGPTAGFILAVMRFLFDKNMWKFIIREPVKENS